MVQFPDKYNRFLNPDEKVLWYGAQEKERDGDYAYVYATLLVLGGGVLLLIAILTETFNLAFFSFFLIVMGIVSFTYSSRQYHYLITNKRIMIDDNPKSKFNISSNFYKSIHRIKKVSVMGEKCISFQLHSDTVHARSDDEYGVMFRGIADRDTVFDIIRDAWSEHSPYQQVSDTIAAVANKHGLEISPFHYLNGKVLRIEDDLDGMSVDLRLNRMHDLGHYSITIVCSNPEDNFLGVSREGFGTGFSKLLGTQDLQIGDKRFDDRFLLQSDNEHFFKKVMTDKIQSLMMDTSGSLDWTLVFGRRKTKSKQKEPKKDTVAGILDAHLIDENPTIEQRQEGLESRLEFTCKNVVRNTSHYGVVSKKCATALEMMIQLAKNIKAYDA